MIYTRDFSSISIKDSAIVGGKGASLGEMFNSGIPVPDGFVVSAKTFEDFLRRMSLVQEIDAIYKKINHRMISSVESASEKIQGLIKRATVPNDIIMEIITRLEILGDEFVAVRSSATAEDGKDHAWAGQLDSYLNVCRSDVIKKVQDCLASLFTPRAIFYRFEEGLSDTMISVAVIVQKMINSEKSGIAFSVHPITEDQNQIIIEAGLGLGEAIVSGIITPDSYVTEKGSHKIIDINIPGQIQVLSSDQIFKLADIVLTIENHYGFPCDIEWAYKNGRFFIIQSRPITTLRNNIITEPDPKNKFVKLWEAKYDVAFTEICASIHDKMSPYKNIIESSPNNLIYFGNTDGMTAYCMPLESDESSEIGYKAHTEEGFVNQYCSEAFALIDENKKLIKDAGLLNFAKLSNSEVADFYNKYLLLSEKSIAYYKLCNDEFQEKIADEIRDWFIFNGVDSNQAQEYLSILTSEERINFLDLFNLELLKIAKINDKKQARIIAQNVSRNYGWLGTFEAGNFWDAEQIMSQALIIQIVPEDKKERKDKLLSELRLRYDIPQRFIRWGRQMADLANLKIELRIIWAFRDYYIGNFKQEIMNRLNVSGDVFYFLRSKEILNGLLNDELDVADQEIENRKKAFGFFIFNGEKSFCSGDLAIKKMGNCVELPKAYNGQIKGRVAMRGKVKGIAKIISPFNKLKDELNKIKKGDILITCMTRPQMIPAMYLASAFVTDEGGVTCHAAIIAREMRKPCIVATHNATKIIKDGDLIEVDADNGFVNIIKNFND